MLTKENETSVPSGFQAGGHCVCDSSSVLKFAQHRSAPFALKTRIIGADSNRRRKGKMY